MIEGLIQKVEAYFGKWGSEDEWQRLYRSLNSSTHEKEFYLLLAFKGFLQSK